MNSKFLVIRAIKRMVDVINEQLTEVGYKDDELTLVVKAGRQLAHELVNYLEKEA